jgi:hypothetical protein
MTATDVLSNHKIYQQYYDNQKKNREQTRDKRSRDERPTNDESSNATSFVQRERKMTCYCCGKKGHLSPECDKKNTTPREQFGMSTEPCKISKKVMMPAMIWNMMH